VSLTVPSNTPVGPHYVLACADDTALVEEADEEDNCLASSQVQVGRPDLVAMEVRNVPATAILGSSFPVTDVVRNASGFPAPAFRVRYYLSGDPDRSTGDKLMTGVRIVSALAAQTGSTGTAKLTVPYSTTPGLYYLLACADDLAAVPETDETNNCVASTGQLQVGRPDLTATAISTTATTAARGTSIPVTDTVKNASLVPAGTSRVQYYLSFDNMKNPGDRVLTGYRLIAGLDPGEDSTDTISVKIPGTTTPGLYFLLACADATAVVPESDETNNCRPAANRIDVTP
jgi:subtilase family serine protease